MTLRELLERVEKLTAAGNFQFECDLGVVLGITSLEKRGALSLQTTPPPYTRSVDAAIGLVEKTLPRWGWQVRSGTSSDGEVHYANARMWEGHDQRDERPIFWANADTPALALIAAMLKALIAQGSEQKSHTEHDGL